MFNKEEQFNDLKDVFKRLVALDIYFDIKNNPNNNLHNYLNNNINNEKSEDLSEEDSVEKQEKLNDDQNSIFSNDNAFTELSSNITNIDNYLQQIEQLEEEIEEQVSKECFLKYIVNDLFNLNKMKIKNKLNYYFFNDPLVCYLMDKYHYQDRDLYNMYLKYFNHLNRSFKLKQEQVLNYILKGFTCNPDKSWKEMALKVSEMVSNELKELGKELNGIIINLYESRVNLNEIYYLINYYNLDIESLSVDVNTLHYGFRMDEPIMNYFNNKNLKNLLNNLNKVNNKLNFKQFYNLLENTDFNEEEEYKSRDLFGKNGKDLINELVYKNVYGIETGVAFNNTYMLEPMPFH